MRSTLSRFPSWLPIVAAAVFLGAVVFLVIGMISASGAVADREGTESAVAAQQDAVATAREDLAVAEARLETARAETADVRSALDEARASLDDVLATRDGAEELLVEIEARAPRFVSSVGTAVEEVEAIVPGLLEVVERQSGLLEAILDGDYGDFNDLYAEYLDTAGAVAQDLDDLAELFDAIPDVPISRPAGYSGAAVRGRVPDDSLELDPPTGPAVITVVLPDEIECRSWGDGGCTYSWTAVFEESNWLGVTIDRIGVRYRRGSGYCTVGYADETAYEREWDDVSLWVPGGGFDDWSGSLSIEPGHDCWPVRGGELLVRWEGTDAEGRRLSGRGTAPLALPG